MTGVILAGGENLRIPLLKGYIEINGNRIIDSNVGLFKKIFKNVVISTNNPEFYFYCGVPMIGDVVRQRGPATGIFSALFSSGADAAFVCACDMPFIKPELIKYIIDKYTAQMPDVGSQTSKPPLPLFSKGEREGIAGAELKSWDAVIPVFEERPQPLLGIYSKNVLRAFKERLDKGFRGLREMLTAIKTLYIKEEEVREIDPEGKSFVNINTIEDYKKAISASV